MQNTSMNINQILRLGGAQAIAALAFGTETIRKVNKISGPGNEYVAEAKRQVFGQAGIDSVAGPSEVLLICDSSMPEKLRLSIYYPKQNMTTRRRLF